MSDSYNAAAPDWPDFAGPSGVPRLPIYPTNQTLTSDSDALMGHYADAIAKIESGGRYDTLGPQTKSGDRAYGKYQVMGANIPEWTQAALGRRMSPEEFLSDTKAQDAVFAHRFGQYVRQYGNPADAASAWFTGGPQSAANANKRDVLGTSGAGYVDKFLSALGGSGTNYSAAAESGGNLLAQLKGSRAEAGVNSLLGLGGQERYQLWPERLARSALSAPMDAMTGKLGQPGSPEFSANAVPRALDMASMPVAGLVNPELGAAGVLGGKLTQVRGPTDAAPVFYSTVGQTLNNAGFNKASPSQWLAYLRNAKGVKGEELDWTGLGDKLASSTEPTISKGDLLSHLADNQVELNEIPKREATGLNDQERLDSSGESAKFANYVLPGAAPESYREALIQRPPPSWYYPGRKDAPSAEAANQLYTGSHWDEPNVLGHVRMNDREVQTQGGDKPLKALFLEELQSDWHQQGRKRGYDGPENSFGPPDAPFKSSWPELLLKRMIREAAEGGYDALAWTPGEVQAARYDLSKHINKLEFRKSGSSGFTPFDEIDRTSDFGHLVAHDHDGKKVIDVHIDQKELPDYVGKDVADRLLQTEPKSGNAAGLSQSVRKLEGLELKVGGEGMMKFYDDMLPNVANKLAKRFGGERTESGIVEYPTEGERRKIARTPVHVLRITPELRKRALGEGFPLFQSGVPLNVQGSDGKPRTLHPVDYDPFSDAGINRGDSL